MSEEKITLDFLADLIRGMRDDVLSLKEDTSFLTVIVLRLERDAARREARDEGHARANARHGEAAPAV
jgi:hypothetical protein